MNICLSAFFPPPNQDCGGGKKWGLSSLSLHNFVPFGLQIKGPCKWRLEDVHCWDDVGDNAGRKRGLSDMSARREEGEKRGWEKGLGVDLIPHLQEFGALSCGQVAFSSVFAQSPSVVKFLEGGKHWEQQHGNEWVQIYFIKVRIHALTLRHNLRISHKSPNSVRQVMCWLSH